MKASQAPLNQPFPLPVCSGSDIVAEPPELDNPNPMPELPKPSIPAVRNLFPYRVIS